MQCRRRSFRSIIKKAAEGTEAPNPQSLAPRHSASGRRVKPGDDFIIEAWIGPAARSRTTTMPPTSATATCCPATTSFGPIEVTGAEAGRHSGRRHPRHRPAPGQRVGIHRHFHDRERRRLPDRPLPRSRARRSGTSMASMRPRAISRGCGSPPSPIPASSAAAPEP